MEKPISREDLMIAVGGAVVGVTIATFAYHIGKVNGRIEAYLIVGKILRKMIRESKNSEI